MTLIILVRDVDYNAPTIAFVAVCWITIIIHTAYRYDARYIVTPIGNVVLGVPIIGRVIQVVIYTFEPPVLVFFEAGVFVLTWPTLIVSVEGSHHVIAEIVIVAAVVVGVRIETHVSIVPVTVHHIFETTVSIPIGRLFLMTIIDMGPLGTGSASQRRSNVGLATRSV